MSKRHILLVAITMLAVLLLIFSSASADMSTNLRIDAVKSPSGLLISETYGICHDQIQLRNRKDGHGH